MDAVPLDRAEAIDAAVDAVRAGRLVVLPTDTVYGVGADPFDGTAVDRLLAAKGRGRDKPPPVLVADPGQAWRLVDDVPKVAAALAREHWPGPLTLVLPAGTLGKDLGETGGTVALRMPDHPLALALLRAAGPLAVSSANLTGRPPSTTAAGARDQFGDAVAVYLDGGRCAGGVPSTIVGFADGAIRVLREGAIRRERLSRTGEVVV